MVASIIDDNTSVLFQAARVHTDYQNQGVMYALGNWAVETTCRRVPSLRYQVGTSLNAQRAERKMKLVPSRKLLTKRVSEQVCKS